MKRLIAEFEKQSFTQIIFPHKKTDWKEYLEDAEETFINIIEAIKKHQKCFIICADITYVKSKFLNHHNLYFVEYETNDTWARDCSALCVEDNKEIKLLDFTFNAWGNKFASKKDDAMNQAMKNIYLQDLEKFDFVLEGGAIESNGEGIILTTSTCLLNKNRNPNLDSIEITQALHTFFGADKILYLEHAYLSGDDTDSHIDTLVRFVDKQTIMYVQCEDTQDEHYKELYLMQKELMQIAQEYQLSLIALPMPEAVYFKNERLPATYANFLFVNNAVLVPIYGVKEDAKALKIFENFFTQREIIPINCSPLIKQHGSLHCVSMNFASGVTLLI